MDVAVDFLQDLKQAAKEHVPPSPAAPAPVEATPSSEGDREYRATVCEEFKWIDFKGIPVLGGHLRVPIDRLFVSLSAVPHPLYGSKPKGSPRSPESRLRSKRSLRRSLFGEVSEGKGIFDILKANPKLVILGDPGSGKTTLLRYVGYHLSLPDPQPSKIGLERAYLPVHIPLREYAAFLKAKPDGNIEAFLPELLRAHNLEKYAHLVWATIKKGEAILLFDGLDEVASQEERTRVAGQVQKFSAACPKCRLILTSRRVGYTKAPLEDGLTHFVVEPLSNQAIQDFIELWCKETDSEKDKQNLIEAISNPRVRALAENPLLITILARVYKAYRNLPERRAGLYAKCVEALLTTWDLTRDVPPVFQDVREANRVLGPIALWTHRDRGGRFVTREELLAKLGEIGNLPGRRQPSLLLTQIEERSGLLREVGLDQYAFTHLTFQEYYVAREIVSRGKPFSYVRRFLRNDRWHEAIILTAGLLDDLGEKPATEFLEHFLVKPSFPSKPRLADFGKLNLLIGCLKDKVEPETPIREYVLKSLLGLVEIPASARNFAHVLPQLRGFSKSHVGNAFVEELKQRFAKSENQIFVGNMIRVADLLFKDDLDRLRFMMLVLTHAKGRATSLGFAAWIFQEM